MRWVWTTEVLKGIKPENVLYYSVQTVHFESQEFNIHVHKLLPVLITEKHGIQNCWCKQYIDM